MSGFKVEKQTASAVVLDDLGITLVGAANSIHDLTKFEPSEIARSADLLANIPAELLVVDPRDDTDSTILTSAESTEAVQRANDSHFGVSGGRFAALDDPTVSLTTGNVVRFDGTDFEEVTPNTLFNDNAEDIEDIVGAMVSGNTESDITVTYDDAGGKLDFSIDDSYLRNNGDTLDSGTLTIADGATLSVAADGGGGGASLIIGLDATATIATPSSGFVGDTDIVNKLYVDSVANGLDWKDSVRAATDTGEDLTGAPFNGTYNASGGSAGTGEFTGVDLTNTIDGVTLVADDRVLIKNQAVGTQNGIFVVTTAGAAGVLERAEDSDTDSDVTSGNATFVEEGTNNADTAWVITTDDPITLNTTSITWTQFAGPGAIVAGIGLSRSGSTIDLDINDLTDNAITTSDSIAFHDADGSAEASGSQTRKRLVSSVLADLDIVNSLGGNGFAVQTSADTYTARTITVNGAGSLDGLAITDGDGVAGNPTIGLDIQNLPVRSDAVDGTDRVAVYNITSGANEYYTVSEIAGAASASNSFETWSGAGNTTGDVSIVADSSTDTVTVTGGIGINVGLTAASDTISWSFTRAGMADTAVVGTDTIPFFDASNSNEPEFRSFDDVQTDLNIPRIATIGGQPIVIYTDTTRSKDLSVELVTFMFANNNLDDQEWMDLGDASNTDVGYTVPLNGTIVMATGHTEDADGNTFDIDVYIDGVDNGSVGTLSGAGQSEFQTTTLDLDVTAGDKLRLRGDRSAGSTELGDVAVVLFVRWRS